MIVQCLTMVVKQKAGVKSFKLADMIKEEPNHLFKKMPNEKPQKEVGHANYSKNKYLCNVDVRPASGCDEFSRKRSCLAGKVENHFIDVGSLTFGGIFGLGENLEHRLIMARTTVQCLMIPRFWLLEKDQNPGNIWQQRIFYMNTAIPSRSCIFKDFLNSRKWRKFKTNLVQRYIDPNSISNPTKVQDIPIVCRIVEEREE